MFKVLEFVEIFPQNELVKFCDKRLSNSKIRDGHLVELINVRLCVFFLQIVTKNIFLTNYLTFFFLGQKSRVSRQTSQSWLYLFFLNRIFGNKRRIIDVRRGVTSFMSITAAVQKLYRKTEGA